MSDNEIEIVLAESAAVVLEDMYFMFVVGEDECNDSATADRIRATIDYTGAVNGTFSISTTREVIMALAENMLGEESVPTKKQFDALGEFGNILCGNVLPKIYGERELFRIEAPNVGKNMEPDNDTSVKKAEARLPLAEGLFVIQLYESA